MVRAIGRRGAARAWLDTLLPVLRIGRAHSLAELVRTRMGVRVLEDLVAPVVSGVYSSRPEDIDVDLAAPGLNGAITRRGSLAGAVASLRANLPAGVAVRGISGGCTAWSTLSSSGSATSRARSAPVPRCGPSSAMARSSA